MRKLIGIAERVVTGPRACWTQLKRGEEGVERVGGGVVAEEGGGDWKTWAAGPASQPGLCGTLKW